MDEQIIKIWEALKAGAELDAQSGRAIADAFDALLTRLELLDQRLKFTEERMLEHEKVISARSEVTDGEPN